MGGLDRRHADADGTRNHRAAVEAALLYEPLREHDCTAAGMLVAEQQTSSRCPPQRPCRCLSVLQRRSGEGIREDHPQTSTDAKPLQAAAPGPVLAATLRDCLRSQEPVLRRRWVGHRDTAVPTLRLGTGPTVSSGRPGQCHLRLRSRSGERLNSSAGRAPGPGRSPWAASSKASSAVPATAV
jgi:hypothetical protein